ADQVELDDHQDHVGHLERDEVGGLEPLARVDDDGREGGLQEPDDATKRLGVDLGNVLHGDRVGQDVEARAVPGQRTLQQGQVEAIDVLGDIEQSAVGDDVEAD